MKSQINILRSEIKSIDEKIFELLKKRFLLVEKVGKYKMRNGLKIKDSKRENLLINAIHKKHMLPKVFVKDLYRVIFDFSYKVEK